MYRILNKMYIFTLLLQEANSPPTPTLVITGCGNNPLDKEANISILVDGLTLVENLADVNHPVNYPVNHPVNHPGNILVGVFIGVCSETE